MWRVVIVGLVGCAGAPESTLVEIAPDVRDAMAAQDAVTPKPNIVSPDSGGPETLAEPLDTGTDAGAAKAPGIPFWGLSPDASAAEDAAADVIPVVRGAEYCLVSGQRYSCAGAHYTVTWKTAECATACVAPDGQTFSCDTPSNMMPKGTRCTAAGTASGQCDTLSPSCPSGATCWGFFNGASVLTGVCP